jgi:hypothetical protein
MNANGFYNFGSLLPRNRSRYPNIQILSYKCQSFEPRRETVVVMICRQEHDIRENGDG